MIGLTSYVKRRWYRSLLPIVAGGLCLVALQGWPTELVSRHDGLVIAISMGAAIGGFAACLTVAISALCTMQMSAAVRAMLLLVFWRVALITRHDDRWTDWREASALPESLFLVVGSLLVLLLSSPTRRGYWTGPRTRGLGVVNLRGDWILMVSIIAYAAILILARGAGGHAHFHVDWLLSGAFAAIGFVATSLTRWCSRSRGDWRIHLVAVAVCIGLAYLPLPLLDSRDLIPDLRTGQLIGFAAFAGFAWYAVQWVLCRWLLRSGWSWRPRHRSVYLNVKHEIDFVASDRRRQQIAVQGWTSFAGCVLLLAGLAVAPDVLQDWKHSFGEGVIGGVDLEQFRSGWAMVMRLVLVTAAMGLIALVSVTVVERLWLQVLVAYLCWLGIGIDWNGLYVPDTSGGGGYVNELVWIAAAIPLVLLASLMTTAAGKLSSGQVGPRGNRRGGFSIRSIMILTLAVGVEIVLIQAIEWDVNLVVVLSATGLLGLFLTFFSMRRHLGKRTWVNLLCVGLLPLGLVVVPTGVAIWFHEHPVLVLLVTTTLCLGFFGSIWLSLGWLQHVGWRLQENKRPDPQSSSMEVERF